MGRSPGFASTTADMRAINTRFPYGYGPEGLNQASDGNSPDHYAKGTPSHLSEDNSAPTACRHTVSGSVTSPSRGSSHLSVAILSSLSVVREYLALRDGPRRFSRGFTCPDLLRYLSNNEDDSTVAYRTVTLCGHPFQSCSASRSFCNFFERPYNPAEKISTVWAIPISLAATDGIDFSFFSSGYLDVSVHRVSHLYLWIQHKSVREFQDQRSFVNSPGLFADFHALQSLLTPRHPP